MTPITAVIFDFGLVLGRFDKRLSCQAFAEKCQHSPEKIYEMLVGSDLEKRLESGLPTDEFAREVIALLESTMTNDDVHRGWGDIFTPNADIDFFIELLIAKGVKMAVLSNTNAVHWPYIAQLPVIRKLAEYGAPMILSHDVGVMKPHPRIYHATLTKLDVQPEHALYLDDIEENVAAARAVGMNAERYHCLEHPQERLTEIFEKHRLK